jgi:hypothetical protein
MDFYIKNNIALRNLQFPVILYYKREIDAPTPDWAVNFACVIQNDWKTETSHGYIIRILQHFATKLCNITNFVMLFQAVMKFLSRSKFSL